jgi:arylformamidase
MRTYDLTLTISPDFPTWPGDPKVEIFRKQKIEDGESANVSQMNISVHTGTHVDAPYHFLEKGDTVENLSLKTLKGRAYVVHFPDSVELVTAELLENADIPPRTRRILIRTKNSKLWAKENQYGPFIKNYVALDKGAAEYMVKKGVKLIGVDYLSVAPFEDTAPTHKVLLSAGVVIVEGLNLSKVSRGRYNFYCLPLKLAGSDGAPARAILEGV